MNLTVRKGLAALVLLLLQAPLPAQVRGVSPTPHLWDQHRLLQAPFTLWYSTPTRGRHRQALRRHHEAQARRTLAMAGPILAGLEARTGITLPNVGITLTDILPADRLQQRYRFSQGGVVLYFTPEVYSEEGEAWWLRRQLALQLSQALLWHKLHRREVKNPVRRFLLRRLPPTWFLLGMAAHLAGPPTPFERQVLRSSLRDRPPRPFSDLLFAPTLPALVKEEGYQQARSFCAWLEERSGLAHCLDFLDRVRGAPTQPGDVFRHHFGMSIHEARRLWVEATREREPAELQDTPGQRRVVAELPGWAALAEPSPESTRFALGLNRRANQSRLFDLSLVQRFGDKGPQFQGGHPVQGNPVWLSEDQLLSIEEIVRPYGQRVHRLVLRNLQQEPRSGRRSSLLGGLQAVLGTGGEMVLQTLGENPSDVLYESDHLSQLGISPSRRWLSALSWADGRSRLLLFDLDDLEREGRERDLDGLLEVQRDIPLDAVTRHRWLENDERVLLLRPRGAGTEIRLLDPESAESTLLHFHPSRVRGAFGYRERIFFTDSTPEGVDRLLELQPRTGRLRERFRDPGGIRSPRPVEGLRWVAYLGLGPEGMELVESPLPEAEILSAGAPRVDTDSLVLPEVGEPAPSSPESQQYRPRYTKRRDSFVLDEDTLGATFEWRDLFNHRAAQGALWRGRRPHQNNWQALYYDNVQRPSWFVGAFDADREDLLGMFPLSNFNFAAAQKGALAGLAFQSTPFQNWTLLLEDKTLMYDRRRQTNRVLPNTDPGVRLVRLQWRLNELSASASPLSAPLGHRAINLSLARSAFGGEADYWELLGDWRNYHPLRKATDTFATRLVFGIRNPDDTPTPIPLDFELGGPETLRGIRSGKLLGERFVQTSFELRHLLTDRKGMKKALERVGLGALTDPLRFDRVYSAFFLDMGTAYNGGFQWGRVERSIGVELRAQGLLTAFQPVALRLGFAHGFGPFGVNDLYLVTTTVF